MREHLFRDAVPHCECGGLVKPRITFFGEQLPKRFNQMSRLDFPKCDLLLVIGTSLSVMPFAGLISRVPMHVPRVLINLKPAGAARPITTALGVVDKLCYNTPLNRRDLCVLGDCQRSTIYLARLLGMQAFLDECARDDVPGFGDFADDIEAPVLPHLSVVRVGPPDMALGTGESEDEDAAEQSRDEAIEQDVTTDVVQVSAVRKNE